MENMHLLVIPWAGQVRVCVCVWGGRYADTGVSFSSFPTARLSLSLTCSATKHIRCSLLGVQMPWTVSLHHWSLLSVLSSSCTLLPVCCVFSAVPASSRDRWVLHGCTPSPPCPLWGKPLRASHHGGCLAVKPRTPFEALLHSHCAALMVYNSPETQHGPKLTGRRFFKAVTRWMQG